MLQNTKLFSSDFPYAVSGPFRFPQKIPWICHCTLACHFFNCRSSEGRCLLYFINGQLHIDTKYLRPASDRWFTSSKKHFLTNLKSERGTFASGPAAASNHLSLMSPPPKWASTRWKPSDNWSSARSRSHWEANQSELRSQHRHRHWPIYCGGSDAYLFITDGLFRGAW